MSYDWSRQRPNDDEIIQDGPEKFSFWSCFELARVGLIVTAAAIPLSIAGLETRTAIAKGTLAAPIQDAASSGRLLTVRIRGFDLAHLNAATLGDIDRE